MKIEKIPLPLKISPPETGGVPSGGVVRASHDATGFSDWALISWKLLPYSLPRSLRPMDKGFEASEVMLIHLPCLNPFLHRSLRPTTGGGEVFSWLSASYRLAACFLMTVCLLLTGSVLTSHWQREYCSPTARILSWQASESKHSASTQQSPSLLSECEANVKGL